VVINYCSFSSSVWFFSLPLTILYRFRDSITYFPKYRLRDPVHIPFGGSLWYMHWYSSVSNSTWNLKRIASPIKFMIEAKFLKNASRDPDYGHYGVVCYPGAIWYILPACKIWQLSLQPFQRSDCGHRNWNCVTSLWSCPF